MTTSQGFQFYTAAYVVRINNQRACTLAEMRECLDSASDASIFFHTFQSLGRHHFLTEGFSSDFAEWVLAGLNLRELAERVGGIDIRDYVELAELRGDLSRMMGEYCEAHPREARISAFEPFHFCEGAEVTVPLGAPVVSLQEFERGLKSLSHASLYYHFLASRLRLRLNTNDFSHWLETLGLNALARRINAIDIYTNTLDTARDAMVRLIDWEVAQ
ncbi:MAG: DUF5752 family protein [Bryobacteraceae bacterium]|jgi:hypothetical protein